MEKQLESIISVCNEPGSRSRTLSAYDTAWVARVPSLSSLSSPAFPESLEWLRKNQTADGYWGDSFPLNSQANTLSTLAAILALNQWGAPQDMSRIQKGIEALKRMSPLLEKETYEVVAFELLLPSMVDEAKDHGWNLPFADYERYEKIGQKVRQKIALFREKFPPSTPATWWFSLEFFGSSYLSKDGPDLQEFEAAIAKNSSASASPSASAFLLAVSRFHGRDIPEVFEYLQTHTVEGGFPHIAPLDDFEVSFSLIYLLYAGIPPSSPFLAPLFEKLHNLWDKRGKTGLGYSSHFPIIDPDDTSHGIRALNIQGESIDLAKHIARFHSEDGRISTFVGERDSSFSVAINVMFLLKGEKESQEAQKMVKSIMNWLLTRVNMKGPPFQDKWHYSPYYPTSRAVLAFEGIHQGCFQLCVDWLLQTQRDDGGWGYFDISTTEETAYAAYSLSFASRLGHPIPNLALEKAQAFLKKAIEDEALVRPSLWIGKILYCPRVTVQALEIAALVSLKDSLRSNLPGPTQS